VRFILYFKGGPGSGHKGHSGRPGKKGGSLPGAGGSGVNADAISDVAHSFLKGKGKTAIKRASRNAGKEYFGKDLLYDRDARVSSDVAENSSDVLTDPDWSYVLEYDVGSGSVSVPEGYDPSIRSSARIFTGKYVNDYYGQNPSGNKVLVTYDHGTSEITVWKPSGGKPTPRPRGSVLAKPKSGTRAAKTIRNIVGDVSERQLSQGYLTSDKKYPGRYGDRMWFYTIAGEEFVDINPNDFS